MPSYYIRNKKTPENRSYSYVVCVHLNYGAQNASVTWRLTGEDELLDLFDQTEDKKELKKHILAIDWLESYNLQMVHNKEFKPVSDYEEFRKIVIKTLDSFAEKYDLAKEYNHIDITG